MHAWPADGRVTVQSLASGAVGAEKVRSVRLLGAGKLEFTQDAKGLTVTLPAKKPCEIAYTLKLAL